MKTVIKLLIIVCPLAIVLQNMAIHLYAQEADDLTAEQSNLSPEEKYIQDELDFADGLQLQLRLPDYAGKVLDALVAKYPAAKAKVAAVRLTSLTMRGKFDDAEKELAAAVPGTAEAAAMKFALADAYFAAGKVSKAKEHYEDFFKKYPSGPPPELKDFFLRSADKYVQMLIFKGEDRDALKACEYFIKAGPDPELAKLCKTQMAELCLKIMRVSTGAEKQQVLDQGLKICKEVLWKGQDLAYGKCVVIMAHLFYEDGKRDKAQQVLKDNLPVLGELDQAMRDQNIPLKNSPMAECRFLMAEMYEDDGRKAYEANDEKNGSAALKEALNNYFSVNVNYPTSIWAVEAGKKGEALIDYLKTKGKNVQSPVKMDMKVALDAQLKDARILLRDGNWQEAKKAYLDVFSTLPQASDSPQPVAELAQACIQEQDEIYAQAMISFLSERFRYLSDPKVDAGSLLLSLAANYEAQGKVDRAGDLYYTFLSHYPKHDRAPLIMFKSGESLLRKEKHDEAEKYFQDLIQKYTNSVLCVDALYRIAICQLARKDYSNAVSALTKYADKLPPCADKVGAMLKIGEAMHRSGAIPQAIGQYLKVIELVKKEGKQYAGSPEEAERNAKTAQMAQFWLGYCYSRLTAPEANVPAYRQGAINAYTAAIAGKAPTPEIGASSLAAIGTLQSILGKADEAEKAFGRLQKEYPDAPESKNVVYAQANALLEIGQTNKAMQVFAKMFDNPTAFKPIQYFQVGEKTLEANVGETAAIAYGLVRKSTETNLWEAATIGLAQALFQQNKCKEAVEACEELLAKNPKSSYSPKAYMVIINSCAILMPEEKEEKAQFAIYQKAIDSLNNLRKRTKDPAIILTGEIALSEMQFSAGKKTEAIATFQRVLLTANFKDPKLSGLLETVFHKAIPMMLEADMNQDALDFAEQCMSVYPRSKQTFQVRAWRDKAKTKGAKSSMAGDGPSLWTEFSETNAVETNAVIEGAASTNAAAVVAGTAPAPAVVSPKAVTNAAAAGTAPVAAGAVNKAADQVTTQTK